MRCHSPEAKMSMVAVLIAGITVPAWAAMKEPKPEHVAKVKAALPAQARVKPTKPRKLLVFTLCRGYYHGAIPLGAKALELMGEKTGAYRAVVSEDPALFEPESLKRFDAVCMMNTTGSVFLPRDLKKLPEAQQKAARERDAALKKSFAAFVRNGGGLVGIHAATDCLYEWAEYGEMMGGYFHGHPWGSGDTVGVKLDDPGHPLCAAFGGQGFRIKDEIYQFRDPYSRAKLRVLMSIDPAKTDMKKKGLRRTDGDYAISWVRTYGKGRVFYCSLGHNESVFWTTNVLQHYLDGIQYALGDIPVDTTPSAKLTPAYFEASKRDLEARLVDEGIQKIATYKHGQDAGHLNAVTELVVKSHDNPRERKRLAARLAALLEADATPAAKWFVCKQLWRVGSADVVPTVARLLANNETADMARYALERMPCWEAGAALHEALGKAQGAVKVGIINSLGERRERFVAADLGRLAGDSDRAVAGAAILALGKIGGPQAAAILWEVKQKAPPELASTVDEALLLYADRLAADGDLKQAERMYIRLYWREQLPQTRAAALKGLMGLWQDKAIPLVIASLGSDQRIIRSAAGAAARELPGRDVTDALAASLDGMAPCAKVLLLQALGDRGDRTPLSCVAAATSDEDVSVRAAALAALGKLGDSSCVSLLAKVASSGEGAEVGAARAALDRLRGADTDAMMIAALGKAETKVKAELIRSLAARRARAAMQAIWRSARDASEPVRSESFKALGALGTEDDLPKLLELLIGERGDGPRGRAEAAVLAISHRIKRPAERVNASLAAWPSARGNVPAQCALVRVFGALRNDRTLGPIREALKSADAKLKEAAIRALAGWQTPTALPDLFLAAKQGPNESLRLLALQAYIRLLAKPSDRPAAQTLEMYKHAAALATRVEEKKALIAGLAGVGDRQAVDVVKRYQNDPALKADVDAALQKIANRSRQVSASHNGGEAKKAIDGDIKTRWATGTKQQPGQWFMIDLGWEVEVRKLVLDAASSGGDYPRGYEAYVSNSPEQWGKPVVTGKGTGKLVEIPIKPPKTGRYIRIVQTGTTPNLWWSIHELKIETGK